MSVCPNLDHHIELLAMMSMPNARVCPLGAYVESVLKTAGAAYIAGVEVL